MIVYLRTGAPAWGLYRQTRARVKKDPQEGQQRPRDTSTVCADISSETTVRMRALVRNPPPRVYLSSPHAGPRERARDRGLRTPNNHCRETFLEASAQTSSHARTRAPADASGREMMTVHGRNTAHLLTHRQHPSASPIPPPLSHPRYSALTAAL